MSEIAAKPLNTYSSIGRMQNYLQPAAVSNAGIKPPMGAVSISSPLGKQVYEYPQASIYDASGKKTVQGGLNIFVFNPAGANAPGAVNNHFAAGAPISSAPIANTSLMREKTGAEKSEKDGKKQKNIVKLTNDYIKTLESFLRNKDKYLRKQGIQDLIKRFEEDETRYENPSLTALLDIALQDFDVHNRMLALSIPASGIAHGGENTLKLLKELAKSNEMYGQEAKMASKALLKASQTREKI